MANEVPKAKNTARESFAPLPEARQTGEAYRKLPEDTEHGWVNAHARQTIQAGPQALYDFWSDVTRYHLWQEQVVSVTPLEGRKSHWVMGDPDDAHGTRVEFDSEITEDIPGRKLAWKSIAGAVEQSGQVEFAERADGRGTVVTLLQSFKMGKLANAAASVAKRGPQQIVIEDLRHFKQMMEAHEIPSVVGQSHGPRGASGKAKAWMYGETNATPPGTSEARANAAATDKTSAQ